MSVGKKEKITNALLVLQELDGNLSKAAEQLNMSKATLMRWRDKYVDHVQVEVNHIFEKPSPKLTDEIQIYSEKKLTQCNKILDERDKWLETLMMFREQLNKDNILKQDPRKLSEVFKLLHEAGTGERLDDGEKSTNNFWTVINQQILNQNDHE